MSIVRIDASPKQLSKLRNGHNVRIKPAIEGEGFNLMVDPSKYRAVTKSFQKNKGIQIQLSPEEILANRQLTPEYHQSLKKQDMKMSGKGIFGKAFDSFVEKTIGKKAKDVLYNSADSLKPSIKAGIDRIAQYAPEASASALSALALAVGQPELVPGALMVGNQLGKLIGSKAGIVKDYFDNPTKYQESISNFQSNIGGSRAKRASSLAGQIAQDEVLSVLNKQLGTNMGNLSRANLASAIANRQSAMMMPTPMQPKPFGEMPDSFSRSRMGMTGNGMKKSMGIVGTLGSQLNRQVNQPPALQSQASGANFQFGSTLPPTFQKYHKGIGSGLYA